MAKDAENGKIRVVVTGSGGQLGRVFRKIGLEYNKFTFIFTERGMVDITDATSVLKMMTECNPDVIINCAAYTAVDKAENEPEEAGRINREGVALLADAVQRYGAKLVHFSTDYVFSGDSDMPYREGDTPDPQTVYGKSKLEGERAVEQSGVDAVVIRTSWLYSEFGHNFVKTMLRLAKEGKPVRVVADQYGSPTYAEDLARAIMKLLERDFKGFNLFHYCNRGTITWHGFAEEIFRQADIDVELQAVASLEYPTAAKRPRYSVLSTDKVESEGIDVPMWQASLRKCLKEIKER